MCIQINHLFLLINLMCLMTLLNFSVVHVINGGHVVYGLHPEQLFALLSASRTTSYVCWSILCAWWPSTFSYAPPCIWWTWGQLVKVYGTYRLHPEQLQFTSKCIQNNLRFMVFKIWKKWFLEPLLVVNKNWIVRCNNAWRGGKFIDNIALTWMA
jgi:hypothetical protein